MTTPPPTPRAILIMFFRIGLSSFGGGSTTFLLMRREIVERRRWMSADDFSLTFGLSKITPGINILSHALLIGRLLAGWPGLLCGLLGLLAPSAAVTIALSAAFVALRDAPLAVAALRGVVPATAGMTVAIAATIWPASQGPRRLTTTVTDVSIAVAAFVLLFVLHWQAPLVIALGAAAGALGLPRGQQAHGP